MKIVIYFRMSIAQNPWTRDRWTGNKLMKFNNGVQTNAVLSKMK